MRRILTVGVSLTAVLCLGACDRAGPGGSTTQTAMGQDAAAAPASATTGAAPRASAIVADGIKLGDRYGTTVMSRDPYRRPCDDDRIEETRRAMVYGGRPCRGQAFPDETTVIFLIDWSDGDDFDQPIQTIAWLGGHYFDTRTNLPVHVGDPADRAVSAWGTPGESFSLGTMEYRRYGEDLFVVVERDTVVGFVAGQMPADHAAERWEVLDQMYRRTDRVHAEELLARIDPLNLSESRTRSIPSRSSSPTGRCCSGGRGKSCRKCCAGADRI